MHRRPRRWDVFCRVVDNFGDLGVAWRLAADLAARGERVRLWIDDASALAWMAPGGAAGVEVVAWSADAPPDLAPGDAVIETFGCGLPPRFLRRMAEREVPPPWIDVQYLSAEDYVERSHGLPSPLKVDDVAGRDDAGDEDATSADAGGADADTDDVTGGGTGSAGGDDATSADTGSAGKALGRSSRWLTRRFFFPGFTPRTGGLLREPGLAAAREEFDRRAWLAARGIEPQEDERLVSLFCYADAPLAALVRALADAPTLLLATPGWATAGLEALLGAGLRRGRLRVHLLPWLSQPDYDRLLWSCDVNLVRGEDSFVRAQWAGAPFVWQAYPQQDGAHLHKLAAFLDRMLTGGKTEMEPEAGAESESELALAVRQLWLAWNRVDAARSALSRDDASAVLPLPPLPAWTAMTRRWRSTLEAQPDLTTQLLAFVGDLVAAAPIPLHRNPHTG